jgi:hypothetical protein
MKEMSDVKFFYEGVMDYDSLPDYMDDLTGCHSFRMNYRLDGSEGLRERIMGMAQIWCSEQQFTFERMSNQFIFPGDDEGAIAALAFRMRWC